MRFRTEDQWRKWVREHHISIENDSVNDLDMKLIQDVRARTASRISVVKVLVCVIVILVCIVVSLL